MKTSIFTCLKHRKTCHSFFKDQSSTRQTNVNPLKRWSHLNRSPNAASSSCITSVKPRSLTISRGKQQRLFLCRRSDLSLVSCEITLGRRRILLSHNASTPKWCSWPSSSGTFSNWLPPKCKTCKLQKKKVVWVSKVIASDGIPKMNTTNFRFNCWIPTYFWRFLISGNTSTISLLPRYKYFKVVSW